MSKVKSDETLRKEEAAKMGDIRETAIQDVEREIFLS